MQGDKNVVLVADIGGTNCRFVLWRLDLQNENHERLFSKAGCSLQLLQTPVSSFTVLLQLHLFQTSMPYTLNDLCWQVQQLETLLY